MLATLGIIRVELPQLYAQIESVKSSAQTLRLNDGSVVDLRVAEHEGGFSAA